MSEYHIDLLYWPSDPALDFSWDIGKVCLLSFNSQESIFTINKWIETSKADYLLIWNHCQPLPALDILYQVINQGIDIAHIGLQTGMGNLWKDINLLGFSWDKLNAPNNSITTSWRIGLDACLIRRPLILEIGGLDPVFKSLSSAGLELGYRCLRLGAIVEYHPELGRGAVFGVEQEPPACDFYCFILRHYSQRWAQYVFLRRMLSIDRNWMRELHAWKSARIACKMHSPGWSYKKPWSLASPSVESRLLKEAHVSVIIPTLGRYAYLPAAIESLMQQSVRPTEVIIVDQNPPEARQPEIYHGYDSLQLKVIWQDERGQSLARNTGLAAARGEYVFLFDDDSIAAPDLIERHLEPVLSGKFSVSTGISIPPPPTPYTLPFEFRYLRLAQTFDTGNALLSLSLARQMGGLDRNYDFGPGTDADFGTRMYLAGCRILHNPSAVRTHFKAPTGGLRVHGARKYNTDAGLLQPYPPITQSYYALRYLSPRQARESVFLGFFLNKFPKNLRQPGQPLAKKLSALAQFALGMLLLPIKRWRSVRQARSLLKKGIRIECFDEAVRKQDVG